MAARPVKSVHSILMLPVPPERPADINSGDVAVLRATGAAREDLPRVRPELDLVLDHLNFAGSSRE